MRLNVTIHMIHGTGWQKRYLHYFIHGFRKHGITPTVVHDDKVYPETDVAVLFGPNYWKKVERLYPEFIQVNRKFLGNVDDNVAISWNGFNGRGQFCVDKVNPKRLLPHSFDIEPWRTRDGYTLLLGQFDLGRCGKYASLQEWHAHVRANTGDKVFYRQWPGNKNLKLEAKGARIAVTLNSTVAIETIQLGVPTVAMDKGSPAYGICAKNLGHVHYSENRLAWLEYLANCQWNFRQIENGDFWRQLWPRRGPRLCDVEF